MPVITATRDEVVELLTTTGLPPVVPPVVAAAAYESAVDLNDKTWTSRLLVIPGEFTPDLLTFDGDQERKPTIHVVLQYKCRTTDPGELDPYLTLAEVIGETVMGHTFSAFRECIEVRWEDGAWVQEHLEKYKVLTIPLSLVFEDVS